MTLYGTYVSVNDAIGMTLPRFHYFHHEVTISKYDAGFPSHLLWIGFCLTGPISLCVDSCVYVFLRCIVLLHMRCIIVTRWGGLGKIEA